MLMNVLFLGDIVGRPGRRAVKEILPSLKSELDIDLTCANGENLAAGKGFTEGKIIEMQEAGVDVFTMGNHVWVNSSSLEILDSKEYPIIRPANYSNKAPGRGYLITNVRTKKVLIINLIGQIKVQYLGNPLETADEILAKEQGNFDIAIVDLHGEYTSEKAVISWYLDGRVNAVVGTHTHVPTADAKILPKGTAFITDVGMIGQKWGSLGIDFEPLLKQYLTGLPAKHEISGKGPLIFSAVLLTLGRENKIKLVQKEIE